MPKASPADVRRRAIQAARSRPAGVSLRQIAGEYGVHPITLSKWLRADDSVRRIEAEPDDSMELRIRDLQRRNRQLEQEVTALRRALAELAQSPLRRNRFEE